MHNYLKKINKLFEMKIICIIFDRETACLMAHDY